MRRSAPYYLVASVVLMLVSAAAPATPRYVMEQVGVVSVNALGPPQCDSLTPDSGSIELGKAQTYIAVYSDPDGCEDIAWAYIWFTFGEKDEDSVCLFYYQAANALYVWDHATGTWVGGDAPGSSGVIETAMVKLYCARTTVSKIGARIIVDWNLALLCAATATSNVALQACDTAGLSTGWIPKGVFIVNSSPQCISLTPSNRVLGHNANKVFTCTYRDLDGCQDLEYCDFMIGQTTTDEIAISMRYVVSENKLYTRNDYGAWVGGVTPGDKKAHLESSQFILFCDKTTVTKSGHDLTIQWSIGLGIHVPTKPYLTYGWLSVQDAAGLKEDWRRMGTYTIK